MRIFVAGATGVIGRRVVALLRDVGHDVTGHGSDLDLFDPTAVRRAVDGHEVVVNLATAIPSGMSAARPKAWETTARIRTEGAGNLAEAAMATGARYFQESVVTVYEDGGENWIDEDHPLIDEGPAGPALAAERHALRVGGVVLRFGFFYGPDAAHTLDEIAWARRGLGATVGHPDGYHPDVHLDDAARAVVAVLEAPSGVYNVSGDTPLRRRERAEVIAAAVGRDRLRLPPATAGRFGLARLLAPSRRVSNARLHEVTGWRPEYPSVREGFPAVVAAVGAG